MVKIENLNNGSVSEYYTNKELAIALGCFKSVREMNKWLEQNNYIEDYYMYEKAKPLKVLKRHCLKNGFGTYEIDSYGAKIIWSQKGLNDIKKVLNKDK